LNNCSCVAYAYDNGIRCLTWSDKLIDIVRFTGGGIDLYIRQAYSELSEYMHISAIIFFSSYVINVYKIYSSTFSPITRFRNQFLLTAKHTYTDGIHTDGIHDKKNIASREPKCKSYWRCETS